MAEKNFAQIGYINEQGGFVPKNIRARDVLTVGGVSAETHMTNAVIHLTTEQAQLIANAIQASEKGAAGGLATLGADGQLTPSQIDLTNYQAKVNAATYPVMLALDTTVKNGCPVNNYVFVTDATGDPSVTSGWAIYRRVGSGNTDADFVKTSEQESLDVVLPDFVAYEGRMTANEQAATAAQSAADAAQSTADSAVSAAATAQSAADAAQGTADAAVSAAATAKSTADTGVSNAATAQAAAEAAASAAAGAQSTADSAVSAAATAQARADSAYALAEKMDAVVASSEAELAGMNLKPGAAVLMLVDNN